jgi:hypothetical protein
MADARQAPWRLPAIRAAPGEPTEAHRPRRRTVVSSKKSRKSRSLSASFCAGRARDIARQCPRGRQWRDHIMVIFSNALLLVSQYDDFDLRLLDRRIKQNMVIYAEYEKK